ncbi:hypothetical protein HALLA_18885 [Halostagnicola larsenii XH-48]|uniref:CARDB domain-containing protein n=2 Tax=Halostagnicola larsenii TaxID=353800 RepID=W0JRD8_9EURY|nr:hypothetical protein HALLA_18885 [Halostagnicola larsenii XH-48]
MTGAGGIGAVTIGTLALTDTAAAEVETGLFGVENEHFDTNSGRMERLEFIVSNDGKRSGTYDYRVRLEHEDRLLGGDERISGILSSGSKEVFDLEFAPPRAGTVAVLVDDEIVDEVTVRSRRSDDEADDDDNGGGDNAGSVATGGGVTIVGKAASAS